MMTLNPIQSAKVSTSGSFHMKYGRVEVEAKLPAGDWIWPAIWMLPAVRTRTDMDGRGRECRWDVPEANLGYARHN